MFRRKKWMICSLVIGMLCGLLAGCNKQQENKDIQPSKPEELSKQVVLSVGDSEITYQEVLMYMQSYKEEYEGLYGTDIWDYPIDDRGNTFEGTFKEKLLEEIIYLNIICAQADELSIQLSEDEILDVDEYTAEYMNSFSPEQLLTYQIEKEVVRKIYMDNVLANKIYESLTLSVDTDVSDEEARQMDLLYFFLAKHTYDEEGNYIDYSPEQKDAVKAQAYELREQALLFDDFYDFASEYTDDEDEIEITVGRKDMLPELEAAAFSLKQGEISDVIETDLGYFVFYCKNEVNREETDAKKEEIISMRQEEAFDSKYQNWTQETTIHVNEEVWNSIQFEQLLKP